MLEFLKKNKKILVFVCVVFISLFILVNSFVIIQQTQKGLILTFGALSESTFDGGLHFKIPFVQKVIKISLLPRKLDYVIKVGFDGAITKDNQTVGAITETFYRYKTNDVVNLYKNYSEEKIKEVVLSTVKESIKSTIGQFDIFRLPLAQEEVRLNALRLIREKLISYPVEIQELKIINYDWSDDFDKQIQETMKAAQEGKKKEQELIITDLEAKKAVKQAESTKIALITQAEGEKEAAKLRAEAKALEGEGIRKYNQSIAPNMEIELSLKKLEIEKIKAEKWNGAYVPNNNYLPIPFNYGSIQQ